MLGLSDDDITYYKAIGLYEAQPNTSADPVVWIELLSPSNKPTGRDFDSYRDKREKVLQSGLVFVEMDYLHERPPTFAGIANYRALEPDSFPYRISVIDPRPDFFDAMGRLRQFGVDEPLPTITIPLNTDDSLKFDFDSPYQLTFEQMFYGDEVDYAQFPVGFNLYSPDDQALIASRMLAVLTAHQRGETLEQSPSPIEAEPLDPALEKLKLLGVPSA